MRKLSMIFFMSMALISINPQQAQAVPISSYEKFIENMQGEPGRGFAISDEIEVEGELASLPIIIIVIIRVLTLVSNADPEYAVLFNDVKVNSVSVFDQLIEESLRPENRLISSHIPNLLGGMEFTATSAFSGNALNSRGEVLTELLVGFGVFTDDTMEHYFAPIVFAETAWELTHFSGLQLNLAPVVPESTTGEFYGTGRELIARPVPAPPTLWLFLLTGSILFIIKKKPHN